MLQVTRRTILGLAGRDVLQRRQVRCRIEILGSAPAAWAVCPDDLSGRSVVYSFGVGADASFDVAMIDRFGLSVDAFDPTPRSVAWVRRQSVPDGFRFHDYGIAAFDGTAVFAAPDNPEFVSFSMATESSTRETIETPVYRLTTIMERLGHDHVDVLKMDIEGAEYEVLEDFLDRGADVRQVLVEFHHRFSNIGVERTKAAIRLLNAHGYRIFYVSPRGEDFSFIRS